ncbi:outer dense fiber protein 3B [Dryobates pubescens]|uniref:outer dense fiber protein 3B n=1 Tax=Dryobates pubescens TaxID=118200 RepID=UPI0023BA3152|nr:outer dense fiber protein 3B [Dryobates pubescens]
MAEPWVGTWRPHRPRGPIAALYSSPGPKYGLPTNVGYRLHDPSRIRAPAYSFGIRGCQQTLPRSPGPAYMLPPGTTVKGPPGTPAFSISSRPRDLLPPQTPGPGCYCPERADRMAFPTAPAYALRSRTKMGSCQQTPGPAAYMLPTMLGAHVVNKSSAPNYSIPGRSKIGAFHQDLSKTPGPCGYNTVATDVYKQRAPQFSMMARNTLPGDNTAKPGPGTYNPEQGRRQGVTFGIRHSQYLAPLIVDVPD